MSNHEGWYFVDIHIDVDALKLAKVFAIIVQINHEVFEIFFFDKILIFARRFQNSIFAHTLSEDIFKFGIHLVQGKHNLFEIQNLVAVHIDFVI